MEEFNAEEVPPLEDMSELLEQALQLQKMKEKKGVASSSSVRGSLKVEEKPQRVTQEPTKHETETEKTPPQTNKPASSKAKSFGGLKKGFLFGSAPKSSGKASSQTSKQRPLVEPSNKAQTAVSVEGLEDIPLIKPQGDGAQNGAQRIQEVQDALKASAPFLENKDWVNDDLLSKIEKHPRLARQLSDPRFSQAMSMFQSNPQGAMKYFQDNPEIQTFFQDFCAILGDHFTGLSSTSSNQPSPSVPKVTPVQEVKVHDSPGADMSVSSSTDPKQATAADEAKMKEIMADPDVVKAFGHPQIPLLFEALQKNPDLAQRMMQSADADFRRHVQTLVKKGLLGFAR
ncbi:uncharacterized protein LOC121412533 [Lytechinus variegatus]|uniref:uncharacterized protein LOC121412533 n=1 Tax=Lytechinus variegatus TaxID=7654 RepID=UPI001BB1B90A|nr:uncharacterized protein LOC121412533 [Lytechinus variegatus]XP_041461260.1 uncharacterized protein LOC121412533 [Lytechinus variegatus]